MFLKGNQQLSVNEENDDNDYRLLQDSTNIYKVEVAKYGKNIYWDEDNFKKFIEENDKLKMEENLRKNSSTADEILEQENATIYIKRGLIPKSNI